MKSLASPRGVLLLAAILFLANLWGYDLWAPDEPYFAEGAREMLADGEWLVPHVNGVVTTDKPPLFFWLIALVSAPFDRIYSLTARLPSVIAALGTLWLTMRLGRRFGDPRTAALAGWVLCTTFMVWEKARSTQIESTLCLLIWVALSAFEAFRAGDLAGRRAGLVFSVATALAVLAKGPVGLLLPLGIVLVTLIVDRDLAALRRFAPFGGPLVFVMIVSLWGAAATLGSHGEYSVWGALREHFLERGMRGMHHNYPWYFYGIVLPPQLLPWSGLVPGALWLALRRRDSTDKFLLVAALFVVLFFSISTEKRELYVLPAIPAFALMVSRLVGHLSGWDASDVVVIGRRWITIGQSIAATALALAGVGLWVLGRRIEDLPYWIAVLVGSILFATATATLVHVWRRRLTAIVLMPAAGFALAYMVTAFVIYPQMEPRKSARPLAQRMAVVSATSRAAGHRVLAYRTGNLPEALAFYSDGVYTNEVSAIELLEHHLLQDATVYAVVSARDIDPLSDPAQQRMEIIERYRLGKEIWLISNAAR